MTTARRLTAEFVGTFALVPEVVPTLAPSGIEATVLSSQAYVSFSAGVRPRAMREKPPRKNWFSR